jgi:hypothetical protein
VVAVVVVALCSIWLVIIRLTMVSAYSSMVDTGGNAPREAEEVMVLWPAVVATAELAGLEDEDVVESLLAAFFAASS